ncbi:hypothetical protein [Pontibacter chinhatensis]|uniref:Uncharacterized protein n=1 Tax=Pontibacter chinhatensis TaxID=1436961 RepID=A0A1I2UMY9_9BACT|nr:hypothetical protein [Pontibacter chinhatensis]SFG76216.1 hypothetical protein SAMN05421739_103536 [Pontibacter chinhatensis]
MNRFLPLRLHLWLALAYTVLALLLIAKKGTVPTLPELLIYLFPLLMYAVRVATGERPSS